MLSGINIKNYINGQGSSYVKNMLYGCRNLSYNGCEIIAIYNALRAFGKYVPIYEIIDYSELHGGLWLDGLFGTYPHFIAKYMKKQGLKTKSYTTANSLDKNKKKGDIYIAVYNHTVAMLHAVMIKVLNDGKIEVYNYRNNYTKAKEFSSFKDYISKEGNFYVVAYKIYK